LDYKEYLKTIHWQRMRHQVLKRAGNKCQVCKHDSELNVHHNNYANLWDEQPEDLIVLCKSCHELYHGVLPEEPAEIPDGAYQFWPIIHMTSGEIRKGPLAEIVGRWK